MGPRKLRKDAHELLTWKAYINPEELRKDSHFKYVIKGVEFYFDTGLSDWIYVDGVRVYEDGWLSEGSWVGAVEAYLNRIATEKETWLQFASQSAKKLAELDGKYREVTL